MSWLFDRLGTLAGADQLQIVVDCTPDARVTHLLTEAAALPATRVALPTTPAPPIRGLGEALFVASDSDTAAFSNLTDADVGVAIGGHAPGAHVTVSDLEDLVSLLTTLLTMRSYAQEPSY